jgi:hypothetical protein
MAKVILRSYCMLNYDKEDKDVLVMIGVSVIVAQTVEKAFEICLTHVIPKIEITCLDDLDRSIRMHNKDTLGNFIKHLKKRVDIDENFDTFLSDYLFDRNKIIHRVQDIDGWDISTIAGREAASNFLVKFILKSEELVKILTGFVFAWQEQKGFNVPTPEDSDWFFDDIKTKYSKIINELIFEKEPQ